ncbi:uncharacterized protein H6S33_008353 [Morchella sextelata]|uniref:uncharacterized protein n=1 Tax=Morchella sextelata TaxID=1174677 RepID=UPI001D0537C3|nr:uncharacterized protein H6S33_009833 [Morchella sextelata]XP_044687898.1 uncharacterized protein H6S33_008353 [Morchella sextelata]KAH0602289.1 hypothetical protein H6S33_009833 [Morchella sextelata]KAH0602703.1 hypothetical protein H6S33_008353 [Morchella sextelata]
MRNYKQTYLFTLLLTLLLLLTTAPAPAHASQATTTCLLKDTVSEFNFEPSAQDASRALTKFWSDCTTGAIKKPFLASDATQCMQVTKVGTANIRLCPPPLKDRNVWRRGIEYNCNEIRVAVMDVNAYCTAHGLTAGSALLEDRKRGFVIVRRMI